MAAGGGKKTTFANLLRSFSEFISVFFGKHTIILTNLVLTLITFGGEEFLEKNQFFECPCEHSLAEKYVLTYTLGICAILWALSIVVYNRTWRICHGCFYCGICWENCWVKNDICTTALCGPYSCSFYSLVTSVFVKSSIVPVAWIFISLVDGDYLACMKAISPCENETDNYSSWKHHSQMIGYGSLAVLLVAFILLRALYRCFCVSKSFRLHNYATIYKQVEDEELTRKLPEIVNGIAPKVVDAFLKQTYISETDWDTISDPVLQDTPYHSNLHKYVIEKQLLGGQVHPPPPEGAPQQQSQAPPTAVTGTPTAVTGTPTAVTDDAAVVTDTTTAVTGTTTTITGTLAVTGTLISAAAVTDTTA